MTTWASFAAAEPALAAFVADVELPPTRRWISPASAPTTIEEG